MTEPQQKKTPQTNPPHPFLSFQPPVALFSLKANAIFWSVASAGLALDLWTKNAIFAWLQPGQEFTLINGFLKLVRLENPGAAFGIAYGLRPILITVSVIALLVILSFFLFGGVRNNLTCVALGLFASGVSGNLYDRIFNDGKVRDFIDVVYWPGRHWPAFNVADSMLCIAVAILLISTYWADQSH